jgi:hypothetical protein
MVPASNTFAEGLYRGAQEDDLTRYETTEQEYRCMAYGLFDKFGQEGVFDFAEQMAVNGETTSAFWAAYDNF